MHELDQVIDEYTLAAFIAGTLTKQRRQEVIEYLAGNADAREVLQMAYAALSAAQNSENDAEPVSLLRPARRSDRTAVAKLFRLREASRYIAATAIVFAIGIVLRLAFGPPTDALRSPLTRDGQGLEVSVTGPGPEFDWPSVPNAYQYRIVVWDPLEARVVGQYSTSESEIDSTDPIVR
ncbi:MAG: hypothetical protein WD275_05985, partial [Rhodothermales bacterium]